MKDNELYTYRITIEAVMLRPYMSFHVLPVHVLRLGVTTKGSRQNCHYKGFHFGTHNSHPSDFYLCRGHFIRLASLLIQLPRRQ